MKENHIFLIVLTQCSILAIVYLQSECAKLKTKFQEEHKHAQYLKVQADKNHEAGRIAKEEVEAIRQELQEEREHVLRLKEDFLRDVAFAESRADFAEVTYWYLNYSTSWFQIFLI